MKSSILIFISFFIFNPCRGQCSCHSSVSNNEKDSLMNAILETKPRAQFAFLYDPINDSTQLIKIFYATFHNYQDITFESNFLDYLSFAPSMIWLYNRQDGELNTFAGTYREKGVLADLFPITEYESKVLNNISKFSMLDDICLFKIKGFSGFFVLLNGKILKIKDDGWDDINTYFKGKLSITDFKKRIRQFE